VEAALDTARTYHDSAIVGQTIKTILTGVEK
jgi:hypothetical protein